MITATNRPALPGGVGTLAERPVSRVGFGAMQLPAVGPSDVPGPSSPAAVLVRRAVGLGVTHIDTAQFYGPDLANRVIRDALSPYPDDLVLATKVGAEHVAGSHLVAAQRPEQLRSAVEANLRSLGVDRLDVVNLRRMDRTPGVLATGDQVVDLDSQLAELAAMRDEGTVGAIGLSNISLGQLHHALPVGIVCVQNAYSVIDRGDEALLALCAQQGIAWVPYFPLGSAFPGRPKVTDHPVVVEVARRRGATPAQVGLAWLLAHDPHTLLIPGTASTAHLEQNVAAGEVVLDAGDLMALDAIDGR